MNLPFPLIPLPEWLLVWDPFLFNLHGCVAVLFCALFGSLGLLGVILWGTTDPNAPHPNGGTAREVHRMSLAFLAIAAIGYVFGAYCVVLASMYVLYAFFRFLKNVSGDLPPQRRS